MADENPDLDDFLRKVDEIGGLVKNLVTANEQEDHSNALQDADNFLNAFPTGVEAKKAVEKKQKYPPRDNTGVNRTVINKDAFNDDVVKGPELHNEMSKESFMSVLEHDAKQRAARKAKRLEEATVIKEVGNREFQAGNYEKAIELYSEALTIIKDVTALWTNRAQSYMKLEQYDKVIHDCDWALRVSEKCLKAYVHKGKALAALHRYDEALRCFKTAVEVEPSKEKVINGYITEVELQKKSFEDEERAKKAFDAGDGESQGIVGIMEKLRTADQLPLYYSGGLRIISKQLKDTNERTLFRTNGGLKLTETHPYISRCFDATPRSLSQEELDLCATVLEAFEASCVDNEENQRVILEIVPLPDQLLRFLESKWKHTCEIKQAIMKMLHIISEGEHMRAKMVAKFDTDRLLSTLFELMKSRNQATGRASVGLLNNLALDKKFKGQLRDKVDDILPAFESLMTEQSTLTTVLPSCVSTVTNLCGDAGIRRKLLQRRETWQACCVALDHYSSTPDTTEDVLFALLGLVLNLTLDSSENLVTFSERICGSCKRILLAARPKLEHRSFGVLSHVLPHSQTSAIVVGQNGFISRILDRIKSAEPDILKQMLKVLTACTQHSQEAREDVCSTHGGPQILYQLLGHPDEQIIGNAALALSHCALHPGISSTLSDTDIIRDALVKARDARNMTVRHNCAILIAKLAQSHPRHLEKLRELDGLGILHNVMKHIKD